jgi:spore coat protein U-like protein
MQGCVVSGNGAQVTGISFGSLNFGSHSAVQTGLVEVMAGGSLGMQAQVICTPGTSVQISVDGGLHLQGAQRRMANGAGQYIPYSLSLVRSGPPPTPIPPHSPVAITSDGTAIALPLRASATLPGAGAPAGLYSDQLQLVVSW